MGVEYRVKSQGSLCSRVPRVSCAYLCPSRSDVIDACAHNEIISARALMVYCDAKPRKRPGAGGDYINKKVVTEGSHGQISTKSTRRSKRAEVAQVGAVAEVSRSA